MFVAVKLEPRLCAPFQSDLERGYRGEYAVKVGQARVNLVVVRFLYIDSPRSLL